MILQISPITENTLILNSIFYTAAAFMALFITMSYALAYYYTRSKTVGALALSFLVAALNNAITAVISWQYLAQPDRAIAIPLNQFRPGLTFVSMVILFYVIWIYKDPGHIMNRIHPEDATIDPALPTAPVPPTVVEKVSKIINRS